MPTAKDVQKELTTLLNSSGYGAVYEWDVAKNATDRFNRTLYSPRVDIGIAPFNGVSFTRNVKTNLSREIKSYLERNNLLEEGFQFNLNPRCDVAIEIEFSGSRKHMLGDMVNASLLGNIGIIITPDIQKKEQFLRIKKYLDFAKEAQKLNYESFNNLIILTVDEFKRMMRSIN